MPSNTDHVLSQRSPAAETLEDILDADQNTVVSSVVVANRSPASDRFYVAIAPNGETDADRHYLAYAIEIPGRTTVAFTLGITLRTDDVMRVKTDNGRCSFTAFGAFSV